MTGPRVEPDDPTPASGLELWIAVDADLGENAKVRRLARALFPASFATFGQRELWDVSGDVPGDGPGGRPRTPPLPGWLALAAVEGLLVNLWGKLARHQPDGDLSARDGEQVEEWARWRGIPGAFAEAFAKECVGSDGAVKDWDAINGKLLRQRAAERARWREKQRNRRRGPSPETSPGTVPGDVPGDGPGGRPAPTFTFTGTSEEPLLSSGGADAAVPLGDVDGFGDALTPEHMRIASAKLAARPMPADVAATPSGYALALTVAANMGLNDNPDVGDRYKPIHHGRGDGHDVADALREAGIPLPFAQRSIYATAVTYKPRKPGDQIHSLTFFRARILAAWEEHEARRLAASAPRPAEIPSTNGAHRGNGKRAAPHENGAETARNADAAFDLLNRGKGA